MNRLNVRCAALLTALVLAIGIGSVGCDQVTNGAGAAAGGTSAKFESTASLQHILPGRRH